MMKKRRRRRVHFLNAMDHKEADRHHGSGEATEVMIANRSHSDQAPAWSRRPWSTRAIKMSPSCR
jgi:hypothetical protein